MAGAIAGGLSWLDTIQHRRGNPVDAGAPTVDADARPRVTAEPPYRVILHNDDINRFEYVIDVLARVLACSKMRAFGLTLRAHLFGRSTVWTGAREEATAKAGAIVSSGPDPQRVGARPLRVTVEPAE